MPKRITSLLVANRSEIAIRVFRSAHELGIRTVGDLLARGPLRPAPLQGRRGLPGRHAAASRSAPTSTSRASSRVARARGVDAIHPGYGFLSENAAFAHACGAAGITFVGPPTRGARAARRQGRRPARSPSRPACRSCRRRAPCRRPGRGPRGSPTRLGYPGHRQGGDGRRRPRHAGRRTTADELDEARRARPPRGRRRLRHPRRLPREVRRSGPGTSRCSCSATSTATSSTCSSATARSSAGTRRSSRSPPPRPRPRASATRICDAALRRRPRRPATTTPGRSSSSSTPTAASSTSSRSTRASRSSTPSPRWSPASTSSRRRSCSSEGAALGDPEIGLPAPGGRPRARLRHPVPRHDRGPDEQLHPRLRPHHRTTARPAGWASASTAARPTRRPSSRRSTTRCW